MRSKSAPLSLALVLVALALGCAAMPTVSSFSGSTANPTSNFSAAASFGCTPQTLNPVWMTGFEHGVTTAATGSGLLDIDWNSAVTITADSSVKRSGNYSMKIVRTGGSTGGRSRSVPSSMVVFRIAFRFSSLPSGDVENILGVWSTNANELNVGYVSATQKLSVAFVGGTQRTSTAALSANTWYVLDMRANFGANPHTADWQLNAVAQTQATKSAASETPSEIWLGPDGTESVAFTAWYDDFTISSTSSDYPIGDGSVLGLSPDAMGTSNDAGAKLSTEAGAWGSTTWDKLDEVPMTSTSDYVKQTAVASGNYLELTFADTGSTCINGVQGELAYHASSTGGNSAKTSVFESGTERVVFSGSMASTTLVYKSAIIAVTSGTWTQAKVNALTARIGYASSITGQPYWDDLMVEYNVDL
jgi:hypothetical protein